MSEIREIIDAKFGLAIELSLLGKNSIGAGKAVIGGLQEIMALDSDEGPASRCVISRNALDSLPTTITNPENESALSIYSFAVEIPREKGDHRKFEDLPGDALAGNPFMIDVNRGVVVPEGVDELRKDWRNLENLCSVLSVMRVVEMIPEIYSE